MSMSPVICRLLARAACDRAVADMTTGELLHIVLGENPSVAAMTATAALIDGGDGTVRSLQPEELRRLTGVEPQAGRALAAVFELARRASAPESPAALQGPADVAAIAQRELSGRRRERLLVIVCDAANRPLRTVVVADGALDRCQFPVREVLNAVLRFDGRAFALAHNHPDGDIAPSEQDEVATSSVASAARVVGLRFLGHVVVNGRSWSVVRPGVTQTPC
jgi:DNA repair protein RadC